MKQGAKFDILKKFQSTVQIILYLIFSGKENRITKERQKSVYFHEPIQASTPFE